MIKENVLNNNVKKIINDEKDYNNIYLEKDIKKKYEYIYDIACDEMDKTFAKENYCDFQNNICTRQRDNTVRKSAHDTMGCCYTIGYTKIMHEPVDLGLCKYLGEKGCNIKCLSCKLFTCRYLKRKGIKFDPDDILILKTFLNKKQKKYIRSNYYTPRDIMIEKLIELE
jgi:hypothetical protein